MYIIEPFGGLGSKKQIARPLKGSGYLGNMIITSPPGVVHFLAAIPFSFLFFV